MAGGAPIRISVLANSRQARRELASFSGQLKRTLGAGAALLGAYGGVELFRSIVNEGSEAQQSLGGVQSVFKQYSREVEKYADRAAEAVGLSENQYRSSATLIGSLLKGQGVALDEVGAKTNDLITLAADLAATFGGDTKTAVESLTSAFKGEFNPIEKYGITLKQSIINTEAAAIAQREHGKALKDLSEDQQTAIKQQATYSLILKRSADAQGQFARETDTLAGQQQRLSAEIANAKAELGKALLPIMTEAAGVARKKLVPALEEFSDWFEDNVDDIAASGKSIAKGFVPPLEVTADVALAAAKALDAIPDPVKETAVQLLIAGKAFKVLNAGAEVSVTRWQNLVRPVTTFRAEMKAANAELIAGTMTQKAHTAAVTQSAQTLGAKLRPAVASVAGMAGMGLLLTSTQQTDKHLNYLTKTAGGAATGFAVGGPLGAAVGGLAGLLWGARDAFDATEGATRRAAAEAAKTQSWGVAKEAALELRDALYGTVEAYNATTAAAVKQGLFKDGKLEPWVKNLTDAGVNLDTITRAILQQRDAQTLVNQEFAAQDTALVLRKKRIEEISAEIASLGQLDLGSADEADVIRLGELQEQLKELKIAYDEERAAVDARKKSYQALAGEPKKAAARQKTLRTELDLTKRQYDAMPEEVRTKIEMDGLPQIRPAVLDLLKMTDDLSGRQVVALVKASGAQLARKEVEALQKRFDLTPKQVSTLLRVTGAKKAKDDAAKAGKDAGSSFSKSTAEGVRGGSGDVRDEARAVVERSRAAAAAEAAKAESVGAQITAGFERGIGTGATVAAAARRVIRDALAAANAEAEVRSPSRKAAKTGKNISKGYAKGIKEGWPDVRAAIREGMASLFDRQTNPATALVRDLRAQVRSALKGKAEKRALTVVNQYTKRIQSAYKAWQKNAKALENAKQQLEALRSEASSFRSSVESSVRGWFDPISAALSEAAAWTTSPAGLLGSILGSAREQKALISQTTNLLNQAAKRGLSQAAYEKILALDPKDANRIAISLATATDGQLKELNGYYASVDRSAKAAGSQAYTSFFKVGVTAQQALVDGLLKDKKAIEKAAAQLAKELERATNRRLKGKKPKKGKAAQSLVAQPLTARAVLASTSAQTVMSSPVINVTVNAPVGSSSQEIGQGLARHLRAYLSTTGGKL